MNYILLGSPWDHQHPIVEHHPLVQMDLEAVARGDGFVGGSVAREVFPKWELLRRGGTGISFLE